MKITAISKQQYKIIQRTINSIDLQVFKDFCNIAKNKHILYYNGEYHLNNPFTGGSYGPVVHSWAKEFPILNNMDYSIAQILAQLIFEQAARQVLKTQNVQKSSKQIIAQPKQSSQLLPQVYVSQQLDARGRDISILDILQMADEEINGNKQLMQYKESVGYIMNMSSKYLDSWALGLQRPVQLGGDKMQYRPTNKLAKKLVQIRKRLQRDWDPDDV